MKKMIVEGFFAADPILGLLRGAQMHLHKYIGEKKINDDRIMTTFR